MDLNLEPEEHDRDIDYVKLARLVGFIVLATVLFVSAIHFIDGPTHRLGTLVIGHTTQDDD